MIAAPLTFSEGDGGQLSAPTTSTMVVATQSGASWIERSTNGGASFTNSLTIGDGGAGWGDFGFTDTAQGFAVHDPANRADAQGNPAQYGPDPATLYLTT
ncbi:MAG: hypothetical protein ACRDWV_11075, partial [Acidimicrobiales bacterium]